MSRLPRARDVPTSPALLIIGATAAAGVVVVELLGIVPLIVLVVVFLSFRNLIGAFPAGVFAALAALVTWMLMTLHVTP